jgi:hypothetical protein
MCRERTIEHDLLRPSLSQNAKFFSLKSKYLLLGLKKVVVLRKNSIKQPRAAMNIRDATRPALDD